MSIYGLSYPAILSFAKKYQTALAALLIVDEYKSLT